MIKTQIPGWGELAIENLILDFNGTIAKDGRVMDGVKELLEKIHDQGVTIYIVTADTNGTVMEECAKLPVEVKIFDSDTVARDKRCLCQSLGCQHRQRQKRHPGIPGQRILHRCHWQRGCIHQICNAGRRSGYRCLQRSGVAALSKPHDRYPARIIFLLQEPKVLQRHRMVV